MNMLKRVFNKRDSIDEFIDQKKEANNLPELSPLEKVNFDREVDLSHLYYSSKIEGTHLDEKRLDEATR